MRLEVGQRLWFAGANRNPSREVTVLKVGRKWAELDNRVRINIETGYADGRGYCSPGKCYEAKEDHDREVDLNNTWADLRRAMDYRSVTTGVTADDIRAAAKLLKIEIKGTPNADRS